MAKQEERWTHNGAPDVNIEKIAALACFALTEEEKVSLATSLTDIIRFADKLNDLSDRGVPPDEADARTVNVWREDVARPSLARQVILDAAPAHDEEFFIAEKTVK